MGIKIPKIFKKKSKEEKDSKGTKVTQIIDGVEVLDLDSPNEPLKNTLEERKENRIIFIILIVLVLFVLALPKVMSWFNKSSIFSYSNTVNEVTSKDTIDGMLEIGKEKGSITAKNIQFYNFTKRRNNEISVVYLPTTGIKKVNEMNIYIELYNSSKNIIYRTQFTSNTKLERKVQGIFTLKVLDDIYKDAKYAKIEVINEKDWGKPTKALTCTNETTKSKYTLTEKVTYNFSEKGLINYKVSKKVKGNVEDTENPFLESIHDESKIISNTNISDLNYDEDFIEYTVILKELEVKKSGYIPLHSHGSILRTVKLEETSKKWKCE